MRNGPLARSNSSLRQCLQTLPKVNTLSKTKSMKEAVVVNLELLSNWRLLALDSRLHPSIDPAGLTYLPCRFKGTLHCNRPLPEPI